MAGSMIGSGRRGSAARSEVKGLTTLKGAQSYDRFKTELEQALAGPGK